MVDRVAPRDPREECLNPALESVILADVVAVPGTGRIHHAVQDHPADPVREQRRIHLAQIGAVGHPVVADLPLAESRPDRIHVPCQIHRRHVRQQPAEPPLAVGRVAPGPVLQHPLGSAASRDVIRPGPAEEGRIAAQRRDRGTDAARVEADNVIPSGHAGAQSRCRGRGELQPAGTGSARIDQQYAKPLRRRSGCRYLRQREPDLPAGRIGVTERYLQAGALHRAARWPSAGARCTNRALGARVPAQGRRCRRRIGRPRGGAPGQGGQPRGHGHGHRDRFGHSAIVPGLGRWRTG